MISRFGRLTQLLLLAVTVLTYNVIAMAISNSLFVSHVGAAKLPIVFILIEIIRILFIFSNFFVSLSVVLKFPCFCSLSESRNLFQVS